MKVLLIEDTIDIGESIQLYLQASGFEVTRTKTVKESEDVLSHQRFDVAVVDWMLPDGSGIELCQIIKSLYPDTPILMETAKFQIEDKLEGFDMGADDYLVKPYDLRELEIRVKKLLERNSIETRSRVVAWDVEVNIECMIVTREWTEVHCTANEWVVLKMLCDDPWAVVSRIELADFIRGDEGQRQSDNKLDVLISWMRKKLGKDFIETVKWVGYRIAAA